MTKLTEGTPVTALITPGMDDANPWATGDARWMRGGLHFATTIAARDKMPVERRFGSVVLVAQNADGDQQAYKWTGLKTDGTDGHWETTELGTQTIPTSGITFVNPDGSTTTGVSLLSLKGLALQGNSKDGFTLVAAGGAGQGLAFSEFQNDMYGGAGITKVIVEEPLEVYEDPDVEHGIRMRLKHGYFEKAKPPGYLAYMSTSQVVHNHSGKSEAYSHGRIWADYIVTPSGPYIEIRRKDKEFGLQEADMLDPNVTGGTDYFVASFQTIDGVAPSDGFIESLILDAKTDQPAVDIDGNLMAVRRVYKKGQPLAPKHDPMIAAGIVNAKGLTDYYCSIVHNFPDDPIRILNYTEGPSGLVVQALTSEGCTSNAMQQFELDTGYHMRPLVRYYGEYVWSAEALMHMTIPKTKVEAGKGQTSDVGIDFHNLTPVNIEASPGKLTISSFENQLTDFYIGGHMTAEECQALAGHKVTVQVAIEDKDDGWVVAAYSNKTKTLEPIYNARQNGVLRVTPGWEFVGKQFIAEDTTDGVHKASLEVTMPEGAQEFAVIVYPVTAQSPCTLTLTKLHADVVPFRGYEEQPLKLGQQHMAFKLAHFVMTQDVQGYASLRYTIGESTAGVPMPWGIPDSDIDMMHLDKTKNVINGSAARGGEGALVAEDDLTVTVGVKLLIWNEQKVSTQDTWWIVKEDEDGAQTKVVGSTQTFTVEPNKGTHEFYMPPIDIRLNAGESIMLRTSDNMADGAFIEAITNGKAMVVTTLQVKGIV
ncbi:hypothetical protein VPHK436_0057 [Vibrio phage K436]